MGPKKQKATQVQSLLGLTQIQIDQQIENCHAHNMFHGTNFTQIEFQAWHDSSISVVPGHSVAEVPIPTVLVGREELVIQMQISADLRSDNLFHPFGGLTNAPAV